MRYKTDEYKTTNVARAGSFNVVVPRCAMIKAGLWSRQDSQTSRLAESLWARGETLIDLSVLLPYTFK